MIRCCIKNCDTDENVVNCTSVFFVGFPTELSLRTQWLNILTSNNCLPDEGFSDATKICSCHFSDSSFGKHPVHGYRFLLPDALPTVLPLVEEESIIASEPDSSIQTDPIMDANEIEDDEMLFFKEEVEDGLPPALDQLSEPESFLSENELLDPSANVLSMAKTIGIEYADGKYYFLQSDDGTDDELVERDSQIDDGVSDSIIEKNSLADITFDDASIIVEERPDEAPPPVVEEEFDTICKDDDLPATMDSPEHEGAPTELDSLITTTSEFADDEVDDDRYMAFSEVKKEVDEQSEYFLEVLQGSGFNEDGDGVSVRTEEEYGMVEMIEEVVRLPARRERKENKHFCYHCPKGFPYESGLKKHLLVHNGLKPHECETCGKCFSQKINLSIHQRRHTGEEPLRKFSCTECGKKCIRMSELKLHMKTHWRKQPHECTLCCTRFADITNFYEHLKSEHKDELSLQDSIDLIAQSENAELIVGGSADMEKLPPGVVSLACTVCLRLFQSERALKKHKRKMHPKVFVCSHCPKQFLYRSLLEKHSRVHTQEKPFVCICCEMAFSQKINLDVHLAKKHKIEYGNRDKKYLQCNFCQKKFDRPSSLEVHTRTHTRERPFGCADCPKTFASNSALGIHIRTHHQGQSILRKTMATTSTDGTVIDAVQEQGMSGRVVEVATPQENDLEFVQYSIQFIDASEQQQQEVEAEIL